MARVSGPVAKPIEPATGEGKGELRGLSCGKEELLPTCSSCPPGGDGERGAGLRGGKGNLVPAVGGRGGGRAASLLLEGSCSYLPPPASSGLEGQDSIAVDQVEMSADLAG